MIFIVVVAFRRVWKFKVPELELLFERGSDSRFTFSVKHTQIEDLFNDLLRRQKAHERGERSIFILDLIGLDPEQVSQSVLRIHDFAALQKIPLTTSVVIG